MNPVVNRKKDECNSKEQNDDDLRLDSDEDIKGRQQRRRGRPLARTFITESNWTIESCDRNKKQGFLLMKLRILVTRREIDQFVERFIQNSRRENSRLNILHWESSRILNPSSVTNLTKEDEDQAKSSSSSDDSTESRIVNSLKNAPQPKYTAHRYTYLPSILKAIEHHFS